MKKTVKGKAVKAAKRAHRHVRRAVKRVVKKAVARHRRITQPVVPATPTTTPSPAGSAQAYVAADGTRILVLSEHNPFTTPFEGR